jgi:hypothetical protein
MIVTYIPLESKSGFKSPGFTVDQAGNLTATSINSLGSLLIGGLPFISGSNLANTITGSNLQTLGRLTSLNVGYDPVNNNVLTVTALGITSSELTSVNLNNGLLSIDPTNNPNKVAIGPAGSTPVRLDVSGIIYATATNESTSTSTGSIVVSGGAGVAKDLNVGGDTFIAGDTYIGGQNIKSLAAALAVALS